jgi:energy-coupling factor transport system ATP-binding protein
MIELDGISVSLPARVPAAKTILDNVSLTVRDGEWVAVAGPNGSGKSTLLAAIAGVCPVSSGRVRADGRVGLLLQEPDNQFVSSSVRNELLLSIEPFIDRRARDARIADAVERFSLGAILDRNPHRISGGEKQRLALATVWLTDPRIVLLDEPVSYLDPEESARCIAFVRDLHRNGAAVVWATPGGDDLREAGRAVYLEGGRVAFDGPLEKFREEARSRGFDVVDGAEEERATARERPAPGGAVVSMRSVSFAYADDEVLRGASGEILEREVLGVAGKNGAGKSTFLSLASGVLDPTRGTIERRHTRAVSKRRGGAAEQNVFYLFQSPERLFFAESILEEVGFGLVSLGVPRGEIAGRASEALALAGLDPARFLERSPFSLSLGEMRRVAFAMVFALRPKLLFLDEPASCLDRSGRKVLAGLVEALRARGSTIVTASHDARYLRATADRILTIHDGGLV